MRYKMEQDKTSLEPIQERFIALYLQYRTITQACDECGVSRGQYYRWKKLPHFIAELEYRKKQLFEEHLEEIRFMQGVFNKAMYEGLKNGDVAWGKIYAEIMYRYIERDEALAAMDRLNELVAKIEN